VSSHHFAHNSDWHCSCWCLEVQNVTLCYRLFDLNQTTCLSMWFFSVTLLDQDNYIATCKSHVSEPQMQSDRQPPCSAGWSWSGVREKYYYLAGGWRLELEWCEREILEGWRAGDQPNTVNFSSLRSGKQGLSNLCLLYA